MGDARLMTDAEFLAWCESWKPCTYCKCRFLGPVCPCERTSTLGRKPERHYITKDVIRTT